MVGKKRFSYKKVVHKKYTYKKGKKFGPYYYETKRVDGKVVTTYLGRELPKKHKKKKDFHFHWSAFLGLFVLAVLLLFSLGFYVNSDDGSSLLSDIDSGFFDVANNFYKGVTGFVAEGDSGDSGGGDSGSDSGGDSGGSDGGGDSGGGDSGSGDSGGDSGDSSGESSDGGDSDSDSGESVSDSSSSEESSEEESVDSEESSGEEEESSEEIVGGGEETADDEETTSGEETTEESEEEAVEEAVEDSDDSNDSSGSGSESGGESGGAESSSGDEIVETNETEEVIEEVNETINESVSDVDLDEESDNETASFGSNETFPDDDNETVVVIDTNTTQFGAVLGQPVKWVKRIEVNDSVVLTIEIPESATNISVNLISSGEEMGEIEREIGEVEEEVDEEEVDETDVVEEGTNESEENIEDVENETESMGGESVEEETEDEGVVEEEVAVGDEEPTDEEEVLEVSIGITGEIIYEDSLDSEEYNGFNIFTWLKKIVKFTGFVVEEDESVQEIVVELNETENAVEIEYYTEAPFIDYEEEIGNGKIVRVSSSDDVHYEDVLIFTGLSEDLGTVETGEVKIFWEENSSYLTPLNVLDVDENGIYDYVEWVAPHSSNQTFRIIVIINAEHLDENKTFVSDIYDDVKELDDIWSETIPDEHFVRVVFERNLTSDRDITIYPRTVNGTPRVEIYEVDGDDIVAEFSEVVDNQYNKVYLDGLVSESQDSFDLRVLEGDVEFDHIIDPADTPLISFIDPTPVSGSSPTLPVNISSSDASEHYALLELDDSVVLWYRFDNDSSVGENESLVYDWAGGDHNGSVLYGNATPIQDGVFGGSYNFSEAESNTGTIRFNLQSVDFNTNLFGFAFWMNPHTNSDTFEHIFDNYRLSANGGFKFWEGWGQYRFYYSNSSLGEVKWKTGLYPSNFADTWTHIALTHNGTDFELYVNGVLNQTREENNHTFTHDWGVSAIGQRVVGGYNGFDGYIDEFVLFNRTIYAEEVAALYNATANQYDYNFDNLTTETHTIKGYSVDNFGHMNETDLRTITVTGGSKPGISFGSGTAESGTQANTDIFVNLSTSDDSGDHYSFTDFNNSLLLWMRMDDVNGSGDPTDLSSYSNNGSLVATATIGSGGSFGNGVTLDGNSDYIPLNSTIDLTGEFSISLWFNRDGTSNWDMFIGESSGGTIYPNKIGHESDQTDFFVRIINEGSSDATLDLSAANEWHMLTVTRDGDDKIDAYVDGGSANRLFGDAAQSGTSSWDAIGSSPSSSQHFDGEIDEVFIFNRTLSSAEIGALYNATATQYENNFTSLADGTYNFTGYAVDSVGNRNETEERSVEIVSDVINPDVNFTNPTPGSGTQSNTNIYVNLTSSDNFGDHYSFTDFNNSLLLWMRMDDVNGSGDPVDLSSYSNNGSLVGDATINSSSGYFGDGIWFDADNDRVKIPSPGDVLDGKNITVTAWINPQDSADDYPRIVDRVYNGQFAFYLTTSGANRDLGVALDTVGTDVDDTDVCNQAITFGEWQFVAFTYDGETIRAYVNDTECGTQTSPSGVLDSSTSNIRIGARVDFGLNRNYLGHMDDILIFDRVLTETELKALYNATATQYENNFTSLAAGTYNFTGYAVDSVANRNETEERSVTISSNSAPNNPKPSINSTDGTNRTKQDLHCFDVLSDDDADTMNVTVVWHNSTGKASSSQTFDYNDSYANGTFFDAVLEYGNTTKGETWHCEMKLFDGIAYSDLVSSESGLGDGNVVILNTPPPAPGITTPVDGASTTDRTPQFYRIVGQDDDGDSVTVELNVSLVAASTCSDEERHILDFDNGDELSSDLLCLYDNGDFYNWSMRSYDGTDYSDWTTYKILNISALVSIATVNSSVEFGDISIQGTNDTTDNSPLPFLIDNDGNSFVNITVEATDLWDTEANPTAYYQFKVDNYSAENFSFNWGSSITTWTNMYATASDVIIGDLNYTNATDTAEVDINVTVPPNEGAGVRSSTVTFTASLAE